MLNNDSMTVRDAVRITDLESDTPRYTEWKREKITTALQKADEQPDNFFTQAEIWNMLLGD